MDADERRLERMAMSGDAAALTILEARRARSGRGLLPGLLKNGPWTWNRTWNRTWTRTGTKTWNRTRTWARTRTGTRRFV